MDLSLLEKKRVITLTKEDLIAFETDIKECYERGEIHGTIHLSRNNEDQLLEIFQYIDENDWVFSAWRNHYHALLHGVSPIKLKEWIQEGRSMGINNLYPSFYASSIVGGIIPIALGTALAIKRRGSSRKVWCFIGDMTMETGVFWEAYKYSQNFNLPLQFVVENNEQSVMTSTCSAWGKKMEVPENVIHYSYEMFYPHHGTGTWVNF